MAALSKSSTWGACHIHRRITSLELRGGPRAPRERLSRRAFGIAGVGVIGGALAGCGSDGSGAPPSGSASSAGAQSDSFPVTVAHEFGETIEQVPAKVASVGVTEQDFLLALGIAPIAVTEWYGEQPFATWPWAQDELGDAEPTVLESTDGFAFVEIASLSPDLVVGTNAGLTETDYDKLAAIAPTVAAVPGTGWFAHWQDQLALIASAVGRAAGGEVVASGVADRFASAAAAHPELAGRKAIFLQGAAYDGSLIASQAGLGTEFLTDLGLVVPSEIDEFVVEGEQAYVPVERIDVLDAADVLIWGTESDEDQGALEALPGFADLAAVRAGRSIYTGGVLAGAIYFSSPLSLPYIVDELVPQLASAFVE